MSRYTQVQNPSLVPNCIDAMRHTLDGATIKFQPKRDSIFIKGPWGAQAFTIQLQPTLTSTTIKPLIQQLRQHPPTLLLTDYVNPDVAAALREQGINFVDAVGNMHLNAPSLFVWQQGFKQKAPAHRPQRHLQTAGLKLLSFLLSEPSAANATYRSLATQAGISLGAVVPIFEDLAKQGFLRTTTKGRSVTRARELLDRWTLGYVGQLFPRILLQTCRLAANRSLDDLIESVRQSPNQGQILLGGEAAAGLATRYLRAARATIHLPPTLAAAWMAHAKLIPDPAGNVDLVARFADGNAWSHPPAALRGLPIANPVLIYGELLRLGPDARLTETAEKVFEEFIAPKLGDDA